MSEMMNEETKDNKLDVQKASELLFDIGSVLDPRVQYELICGSRTIGIDETYESSSLSSLPKDISSEEVECEYKKQIRTSVVESIKEFGYIPLTMFTCPNGDATKVDKDFSRILPDKFDQNQILFQRIPLIIYLMREFKEMKIPLAINLIIGDTDFLTYYFPMIEEEGIDIDLNGYFLKAKKYKSSICNQLRNISACNENLFDVFDFADMAIDYKMINELRGNNRINVISILLNTECWNTEDSGNYNMGDLNEEMFYTKRRCNSPERFDKIFANKEDAVYLKAAKIKFQNYAIQGEFVRGFSKILLIDELPPALKSRMIGQKVKDFQYIFPWIRKEDKWRNSKKEKN